MTENAHHKDESTREKVEEELAKTADDAELAAWETVYEVKDLAHDAVEKLKHLGHHHKDAKDTAKDPEAKTE
ncbi:MAG: hypothetical protein JWQ81_4117 [Amycolatopsis sp.]|jgi:hypothetical protein|uniref:hypothetical protein n=1 Tax=Amycolatopsis sp. TaxID=37632 RepID=UPI00260CE0EB|nr:hypothetical protein [Amycolatopsis sp.]MCU1683378.1 hypothetical protein [Amycolatopsis sp.]